MTASGTLGYGLELADFVDFTRLGGIFVKGTTVLPRQGNDYPRMAETAQGMLNCVGLQNKGVDYFSKEIYPKIKGLKTNFFVNVSGSSPEDYAACAARVNELEDIPNRVKYLLSEREGWRDGFGTSARRSCCERGAQTL